MSSSEAIASFATLILADADIEITSDKILALAKSANAQLEPVWAEVFAQATEGRDLKEILFAFGAVGGGAAAGGAAAAAAGGDAAAPAAAEEEKKEESESDEDMGLGLFD